MGELSKIEWTTHTFNPWMGCQKVSPGCANCYAERDMDHRYKKVVWGPMGTRVKTSEANWQKPLEWNSIANCAADLAAAFGGDPQKPFEITFEGRTFVYHGRPRVFCASLADLFEEWGGAINDHRGNQLFVDLDGNLSTGSVGRAANLSDLRTRLFELIDRTPYLDWLLLTKRPENIRKMWPCYSTPPHNQYRENVWIGTSVENQEQAEKRIPKLLECRDLAPVLFLSCEPLLGPVDLRFVSPINKNAPCVTNALTGETVWPDNDVDFGPCIDWVICGGESGPNARPMHPGWARSLRDQCLAAEVPFLFKQWGEFGPEELATDVQKNNAVFHVVEQGERVYRLGKSKAGRLLDGVEFNQFPVVGERS